MGKHTSKPVYLGYAEERVKINEKLWEQGKKIAAAKGYGMSEWILMLIQDRVNNI
jgi:hypothetical protein